MLDDPLDQKTRKVTAQSLAASTPIAKLRGVSRAGLKNETDADTAKRTAAYKDKNAPESTYFDERRMASPQRDGPPPRNIQGKTQQRNGILGQPGKPKLPGAKEFATVCKKPVPLRHKSGSGLTANPTRLQQPSSVTPLSSAKFSGRSLAIRQRSGSGLGAGSASLQQPEKPKPKALPTAHVAEKPSTSRHNTNSGLGVDPVELQRHEPTPASGVNLTAPFSSTILSDRPRASRHMSGSGLVAGPARSQPPAQQVSSRLLTRRSGLEDTNMQKNLSRKGKRPAESNSRRSHDHTNSYRPAAESISRTFGDCNQLPPPVDSL